MAVRSDIGARLDGHAEPLDRVLEPRMEIVVRPLPGRNGSLCCELSSGVSPEWLGLVTRKLAPHLGQRIFRPPGGMRFSETLYGAPHPSHSTLTITYLTGSEIG